MGDVPEIARYEALEEFEEPESFTRLRNRTFARGDPGNQHATAKVFAAWWAAELATRLPQGMTVNAVLSGSTPETHADRNAPFLMKRVLLPIFKLIPGKSHTVNDGADRYLEQPHLGPNTPASSSPRNPRR